MSKKTVIPETTETEAPTTGNGRTPLDPIARAEKILASQAAWRAKNPEKVKSYQLKWRTANKDKVKAAHKRYQTKNAEKVKEWHKKSQAKQRAILAEAKRLVAEAKGSESVAS